MFNMFQKGKHLFVFCDLKATLQKEESNAKSDISRNLENNVNKNNVRNVILVHIFSRINKV